MPFLCEDADHAHAAELPAFTSRRRGYDPFGLGGRGEGLQYRSGREWRGESGERRVKTTFGSSRIPEIARNSSDWMSFSWQEFCTVSIKGPLKHGLSFVSFVKLSFQEERRQPS